MFLWLSVEEFSALLCLQLCQLNRSNLLNVIVLSSFSDGQYLTVCLAVSHSLPSSCIHVVLLLWTAPSTDVSPLSVNI